MKLVYCFFCILLALSASGQGVEHDPFSMRLSENWEFVRGDLGGVWEALRSDKLSGSLPVWQKVTLPHCYNASDSVDPDTPYYEGPAWYRTQLKIENPFEQGRTLLFFEGAGQKTEVYVDQEKVGSHVGGYDEFTIDITDAVNKYKQSSDFKKGSNDRIVKPGLVPVSIRCDNSRDVEMIPSDLSDFNLYGGIYRYLNLVYVPAVSFQRVHINTQRNENDWKVSVEGRFYNFSSGKDKVTANVRILSPDGKEVLNSKKTLSASQNKVALLDANVKAPYLWSTDDPKLYRCIVELSTPYGKSVVTEHFGFRWFEFAEKGPFYLNGKRLLLQGTHRHEDHAGLAAAITEELMAKEIRLMKEMGVNFLRLGHYQQSGIVLNLCDQLGILVWEEIPWCRGGLGGEGYKQQARDMLTAMIDQHRNHPSVIIWGLGNENDWPGDFDTFDKQAIREFMKELHELSHSLDAQRKTAIRRCAFCSDIVDVYSPSIWAGWYRGKFVEYKDVSEAEMKKVDRFLHVEWGGDSHAGRHSENPYAALMGVKASGQADERGMDYLMTGGQARASKDGDWSESYMCDLIDWHLKEQETMDWLTGTAFWIFKDFSTPLRPENPVPFMNQKGAVERDLTPKESYYVYQSYWTEKPMVRIYAHNWPVRWGKRNELKTVKVYSNCTEAELFVNGQSAGKKLRSSQDYPAAGLRWEVKFVPGMNHLKAVARKDGVEVIDEITLRYETRQWEKPDHLDLRIIGRGEDTVTIQATLFDANGVICLDSRQPVEFGLTGDGRLMDNLGTSRGSRKVQLYNGRAQIDVRLNGGKSVASVSSEGLKTRFVEITPAEQKSELRKTSSQRARDIAQIDRRRILKIPDSFLALPPVSIRDYAAPVDYVSAGDFYSVADYRWPNPDTEDGLPYVGRDGQSNPNNFFGHRIALRTMRDAVAALAAAYALEGHERYAEKAVQLLHTFFLNEDKRMNPHLLYAQAIPGVTKGRSIGIIDTLHLAEVPLAVNVLTSSKAMTPDILEGLKSWFTEYSDWLVTHPQGIQEMNHPNNHSVAFFVQLATFARLTGDREKLDLARQRFKEVLLPSQMDMDGSFPLELARTKPFGYSIFQLDNMSLLCELLSTETENLWTFTLPDGRSMAKAMDFLYEYMNEKSRWPYPADVEHFEKWPVRQPCLMLAGYALGRPHYIQLWQTLEADPEDMEVRRNMAVTQPLLWLLLEDRK